MSVAAGFDAFEHAARANGCDEVIERRWAPGLVLAEHAHPFDVTAQVASGEMWLTHGGATRHLRAGDTFEVPRDALHAERYGAEGTVVWVGRRHPR